MIFNKHDRFNIKNNSLILFKCFLFLFVFTSSFISAEKHEHEIAEIILDGDGMTFLIVWGNIYFIPDMILVGKYPIE